MWRVHELDEQTRNVTITCTPSLLTVTPPWMPQKPSALSLVLIGLKNISNIPLYCSLSPSLSATLAMRQETSSWRQVPSTLAHERSVVRDRLEDVSGLAGR
jgi:hypothetical protein